MRWNSIAGAASHFDRRGERTGVIWVDAHTDMNTPETTPSGNIHGMPLAVSLGYGSPELTDIGVPGQKIYPENTVLIGIRSIDDTEKALVRESGITVFTMRDIDERGMWAIIQEAIHIATGNTTGLHLSFDVDSLDPKLAPGVGTPVSGGLSGAENGTLVMMAAARQDALDRNRDVLEAVGEKIFHVGEEIGAGQTVKAALQAFIGASFAGIFESLVLGAKAGVSGETMYEVFGASGVGGPLFHNCARLIMDRQFKDTGSHIGTMYKDLSISMALGKDTGVPMFTTAAAFELFRAGISKFPTEDNWAIVKLLEELSDTEVTW